MSKKLSPSYAYAITVTACLLLVSLVLPSLPVFVFIPLLMIYLGRSFHCRYLITLIMSTLVAIVVIGVISNTAHLFGHFDLFFISGVVLSFLSGYLVHKNNTLADTKQCPTQSRKSIWIGVAISGIVFLFLYSTLIFHKSTDEIISFLSIGEDNISHFTIFNYILQTGSPALGAQEGIWQGLANYPQAIHSFCAYIISDINDHLTFSPNNLLRIYYFFEVTTATAAVFLVTQIYFIHKKRSALNTLASIMIVSLLAICILVPFIKLGYFAQITAALYMTTFVFCIALLKNKPSPNQLVALLSLVVSGILVSWYLASILLIVFGVINIQSILRAKKIYLLVCCTVVGVSALSAVYHIFIGRSSVALQDSMGNPFGLNIVYIVMPAVLLLAFIKSVKNDRTLFQIAVSCTIGLYLFGILQLFVNSELNYFFYKLAVLAILGGTLCLLASSSRERLRSYVMIALSSFVLTYALVFNNYVNHIRDFVVFTPNTYLSLQTIQETTDDIDRNIINMRTNILYVNDCSYFGQYTMNRWLGAIFLTQSDSRRKVEIDGFSKDITYDSVRNLRNSSYTPLSIQHSSYCPVRPEFRQ